MRPMPSFARRSAHPARALPPGIFVGDVADRARDALVTFLRLAARGSSVDRTTLTEWMFGPYLDAISIGRTAPDVAQPTLVLGSEVENADAASAVAIAALGLESLLRAFHSAPDLSVAAKLVESGVVEPIIDERSARGYAPLADASFSLGVRTLSITAAELLTRPERLFKDLVVTEGSVELAERPIISGVAMRTRQTWPWRPAAEQREQNEAESAGAPASSRGHDKGPSLAELVAAADATSDEE
jgi:hypothetical protein